MLYSLIINGFPYSANIKSSNKSDILTESKALSPWYEDIALMPVTKDFTAIESGTDVGEYMNPDYNWIPYPYLYTSRNPEKNIYQLIADGYISEDKMNVDNLLPIKEGQYVKDNIALYKDLMEKIIGSPVKVNKGVDAGIDKALKEIFSMMQIDQSKDKPYFESQQNKDTVMGKFNAMIDFCTKFGIDISSNSEFMDVYKLIEGAPVILSAPEQQTAQTQDTASTVAQTIKSGSAKASRTNKTTHVLNTIMGHGSDPRLQNPAVQGPVRRTEDGDYEIDYSTIEGQDTEIPINPVPQPVYPNQQGGVMVPPPPVQNPTYQQINPPKQKNGKNDIVDGNPNPQVIPDSEMVDPTINDEPSFADFVQVCPELETYRKVLPDKYSIRALRDDKDIIRLKAIDNVDGAEKVIDELSITFDNVGIFTKTPKFWPGVDPDTTFDFERPLKFSEETLTAYMSAYIDNKPLDKCISDDMYLVSESIVDLNESVNILSIWNIVDGQNNHDAMQTVMKNIKLALEKDKKFKNKLGKDRMIMTAYTDVNNFVLETPLKAPSSYNGVPINKAHVVYTYNNGKVAISAKK